MTYAKSPRVEVVKKWGQAPRRMPFPRSLESARSQSPFFHNLVAWGFLLMLAATVAAADGPAQPPAEKAPGRFLRLTRDKDNQPVALETPIMRFGPADGQQGQATVDLVAAVHIGEKGYYEQLNREFKRYDAILYELVAPEGSKVPQKSDPGSSHPLSLLQNGMKDLLALEFQLKGIDYTAKNMVHADMSPDKFAESMEQRGESPMTMLARMLGYAMTQQSGAGNGAGDGQLLLALFDKNRTLALKRVLAEQFENSEGSFAALEGPQGSTLIAGRNKVALDVLRKELDAGKKKIAIFYGAAHMPDMEARLRDEFGMTLVSTRWLAAWNLQ
jgi:hypothetical protein